MINKVMIMGNLTRDVELRQTASGAVVGDMGIAMNESYKTELGEKKERTVFVSVTLWGRQAETCAEYLEKGRKVFVEGKLKYDTWEKDGKTFSKLSVTAVHVEFLGGKGESKPEAKDNGDKLPF